MLKINVELKVLYEEKKLVIKFKERSKIKSINYNKIINEEWQTSDVKTKWKNSSFFFMSTLLVKHIIGKNFF
jgi:phage pi2 protein 07